MFCKRCRIKRRTNLQTYIFTRGYCQNCYGKLLRFGFDERAVKSHELVQELKQEIRHVPTQGN